MWVIYSQGDSKSRGLRARLHCPDARAIKPGSDTYYGTQLTRMLATLLGPAHSGSGQVSLVVGQGWQALFHVDPRARLHIQEDRLHASGGLPQHIIARNSTTETASRTFVSPSSTSASGGRRAGRRLEVTPQSTLRRPVRVTARRFPWLS